MFSRLLGRCIARSFSLVARFIGSQQVDKESGNSFDLRVREKDGGKKREVCQVDGPEAENILLRKITRQDIFIKIY